MKLAIPRLRFSLRALLLATAIVALLAAYASTRTGTGLRCSNQKIIEPQLGRRPISTRVVVNRTLFRDDELKYVFVQLPNYSLSNYSANDAGPPMEYGISFLTSGIYLHGQIVKIPKAPAVLLYDPVDDKLLQIAIEEHLKGNHLTDLTFTRTWQKQVIPKAQELASKHHAALEKRNGRKLPPTW